ncbi:MAG TPA: GGDEF domain-containing protein [Chondromyces sp.]|nr:GGDEF domain-containing protein [Chondromyces sp.]
MSYRGRIISIIFVAAILLFTRDMVKMRFGQAVHTIPIPAVIVLVIAWHLGKQYDKYVYLSTRDALTGLYNRRYVSDQFPQLKREAGRKKASVAVLLVDVNDFKQINDRYGHEYEDRILEEISGLLNHSFGRKDIIARWGENEFLIIFPFADEGSITDKIRHFKDGMKNRDGGPEDFSLSVSIGKATYPSDAGTLKKLIAGADSNMYELKMDHKQKHATNSKRLNHWILHLHCGENAPNGQGRPVDLAAPLSHSRFVSSA